MSDATVMGHPDNHTLRNLMMHAAERCDADVVYDLHMVCDVVS